MMLWTAPPHDVQTSWVGCRSGDHDSEELDMQAVTMIGLDIAKSVFQVHGIDAEGQVVVRQQFY